MKDNFEFIDIIYRFWGVSGIGSVQTNKFILSLRKEESLSQIKENAREFLSPKQYEEFSKKSSFILSINPKHPIDFISIDENHYPLSLKTNLKTNTPPILSYIGNLNLLKNKKAAFSGSRNVSEKGLNITKDCTEQLCNKGITIVSGYAKGVDFIAHYTALEQGGTTIIVLPEGINLFTIKKEFKTIWDWNRILVISEFIPNEKWMASRAMKRNNTIISLSDIVFVIEAGESGGSLDAGEKTLQFGKHLFVPQYGKFPDSAAGNSLLLKKGAYPIKMSRDTDRANLNKVFEVLVEAEKKLLF